MNAAMQYNMPGAYAWLSLRTAIVTIINVASTLTQWTLLIGVLLLFFTHNPFILAVGVAALALVTAFSFITLPVEFDASRRALAWLNQNYSIMRTRNEHEQAKDALWWAAMTYVVAGFECPGLVNVLCIVVIEQARLMNSFLFSFLGFSPSNYFKKLLFHAHMPAKNSMRLLVIF